VSKYIKNDVDDAIGDCVISL